MNEEEGDTEFSIPSEMVDKLYELSGGVDKYKGVILAASSDAGRPLIYQRFGRLPFQPQRRNKKIR